MEDMFDVYVCKNWHRDTYLDNTLLIVENTVLLKIKKQSLLALKSLGSATIELEIRGKLKENIVSWTKWEKIYHNFVLLLNPGFIYPRYSIHFPLRASISSVFGH